MYLGKETKSARRHYWVTEKVQLVTVVLNSNLFINYLSIPRGCMWYNVVRRAAAGSAEKKLRPCREEMSLTAMAGGRGRRSRAGAGPGARAAASGPAGWKSRWEAWLWCSHWLSWYRKATWWCWKTTQEKEIKQENPYLYSVNCHPKW